MKDKFSKKHFKYEKSRFKTAEEYVIESNNLNATLIDDFTKIKRQRVFSPIPNFFNQLTVL